MEFEKEGGKKGEGSGFDEIVADGVVDELGEGMEIELEHDVGAMGFRGVDADVEEGGDLLVRFALGKKLQDFAFAGSETEAGADAVGGREIVGWGRGRDASGEVGFVVMDGVDSSEKNAVGIVLEDVTAGASFDDLLNEVVGFMHGEDQDFGGGGSGADTASSFDAVEERHADIEDGDVWFEFGSFFDGVATIGGFGADLPARTRFQKSAKAGANNGMIIRNQNAQSWHNIRDSSRYARNHDPSHKKAATSWKEPFMRKSSYRYARQRVERKNQSGTA